MAKGNWLAALWWGTGMSLLFLGARIISGDTLSFFRVIITLLVCYGGGVLVAYCGMTMDETAAASSSDSNDRLTEEET